MPLVKGNAVQLKTYKSTYGHILAVVLANAVHKAEKSRHGAHEQKKNVLHFEAK